MFIVFTALSILAYVVFMKLDASLRNQAAPAGIVSFELAGSSKAVQDILASWNEEARLNSAFGLGFDFLFMPLYAVSFSMGILLVKHAQKYLWQFLGDILGWLIFVAVIFDCVENVALFSFLRGNYFIPPEVVAGCAYAKFGILVGGFVYLVAGFLQKIRK